MPYHPPPVLMLLLGCIAVGIATFFVLSLLAVATERKYGINITWEPFAITAGVMMVYLSQLWYLL